jgi:serine/threonine-protein kinase
MPHPYPLENEIKPGIMNTPQAFGILKNMTINKYSIIVAAFAILFAGQAAATDYFGAMAYCPKTQTTSWSNNYQARDKAEGRAIEECEERGGKECQSVLWFKNACGSLALGTGGAGSGWGTSEDRAELEAMKSCSGISKKCEIKFTKCTSGYDD